MTGSLWGFYLWDLSILILQQFFNYTSGFPILHLFLWVSAVSCDSPYLPICLFNFRGSGLPGDLISLTDIRNIVKFYGFCFSFYLLLGLSGNIQAP